MQETLAAVAEEIGVPVQMRVGVNTGEVLVGAMRAGGDPTVMGDVVNTAQRLQKLAEPGEVIVGADHVRRDARVRRYEALGLLSVRGRDEPVEAFRAVRVLAPPGRRREPAAARRSSAATPRWARCARSCRWRPAAAGRSSCCCRRRGRRQEPPRERGRRRRARGARRARARSASACPTATPTRSVRSPRRCATRAASKGSRPRREARRRVVQTLTATLGLEPPPTTSTTPPAKARHRRRTGSSKA